MPEIPSPRQLLQQHFGFREFLEGQERVVTSILQGNDVVVIMPTGGGKSLCFQLPALMLKGVTLVVSPLIALMKDQVESLIERRIPATFINSSLTPADVEQRIRELKNGQHRLVYVAPERFKSPRFTETIAAMPLSLVAIDEAHCISQWGHDFRPDYLRLRHVLAQLKHPRVAALTATATPEVRDDIIAQLALGKDNRKPPQVFVSGFARRNLTLAVREVQGQDDKLARLTQLITQLKSGIVYCATRKNVERVAGHLMKARLRVVAYHAGMTDEERSHAQEQFMSGKCPVAVATNAFGMGIDRSDLRFVVHHDIPGSIESYYQEAGRAGRDGEPSHCELLFNYADVRTQEFFIEGANPTREIIAALHSTLLRLCEKGPIEMPIAEIAEEVPEADNDMVIGSTLHLLQRCGFIQRDYRQGSRTYTTSLVEPVKQLGELRIDFAKLDAKRERDFARLRKTISYADSRGCRHQFILQYFGDPDAPAHCPICDNCQASGHQSARLPTNDETIVIQKALSCVARVDGRFGRSRIAQTLVGSRSKEVLDARLDQLPTHGQLADCGADYVWALLNALIQAGCIEVSKGEYPTLSLTELGGEVMRKKKQVALLMPSRETAKPARKSEGKSTQRRTAPNHSDEPCDPPVFEALRQWRRDLAAKLGDVPPYTIYPDRTLKALSVSKPKNESELRQVKGIGDHKVRQFGAQTLEVLRKA